MRRVRRENAGGELAAVLAEAEERLAGDRDALLAVLRRNGVRPSRAKVGGARVAERLGRLKPNGHLTTYSPLSRLLELEALDAALAFTRALWQSLGDEARAEGTDALRARLEPHRLAAARAVR